MLNSIRERIKEIPDEVWGIIFTIFLVSLILSPILIGMYYKQLEEDNKQERFLLYEKACYPSQYLIDQQRYKTLHAPIQDGEQVFCADGSKRVIK